MIDLFFAYQEIAIGVALIVLGVLLFVFGAWLMFTSRRHLSGGELRLTSRAVLPRHPVDPHQAQNQGWPVWLPATDAEVLVWGVVIGAALGVLWLFLTC